MSTTVTPAELARRARINTLVNIDENEVVLFLEEWAEQGIAFESSPGRWRLTRAGRAMFAGWALGLDLDNDETAA